MVDIVPELLEFMRAELLYEIGQDSEIVAIERRINQGTASMVDVHRYSEALGTNLSAILRSNIVYDKLPTGKLYYNIADRIIRPLL